MKFRRDRRSAHTAAFRSHAVPPQRPVAGRRCLNLVQPRPALPRTQYPVRGRYRLSRSQRAPRITAAAHPKVSPGRNPNPARVSVSDVKVPEAKKTILADAQSQVDTILKQYKRGLITDEERYNAVIKIWTKATDDVKNAMKDNFDSLNPVYMMAESGARRKP